MSIRAWEICKKLETPVELPPLVSRFINDRFEIWFRGRSDIRATVERKTAAAGCSEPFRWLLTVTVTGPDNEAEGVEDVNFLCSSYEQAFGVFVTTMFKLCRSEDNEG